MSKSSRPSLRAIAEKSGVHQSTVSRVLKNDPRISVETARRVRKAADALGYVPDPELGKLMSHMRTMRDSRFDSTIGFLLPDKPYPDPFSADLLAGARKRTAELGYRVDEFPVDHSVSAIRSTKRVIHARNIEGLLILPSLTLHGPPALDYSRLCVVNTGTFSSPLSVHEIYPDHIHNIALVMEAMRRRKPKRPGLITWPELDDRQHHAAPMAYFEYWYTQLEGSPLPPFHWKGEDQVIETNLRKWYTQYRPDLLIVPNPIIHEALPRSLKGILKKNIPCLGSSQPGEGLPGVDQRPYDIGRAAINMLTAHVQRNEQGKPTVCKHMRIPGIWVE